MDASFFIPFVNATTNLCETMLMMKALPGKPQLVSGRDSGKYEVFGLIGLSGDLRGTFRLKFEKVVAANVVEKLAGERIEPGTHDFADAIGELSNMIAGSAKAKLGLPNASITTPTVAIGDGISMARMNKAVSIEIPFILDKGDFAIEVTLQRQM